MNNLPTEILTQIFSECALLDQLVLSQTCRRWHNIIRHAPQLQRFRYHYPDSRENRPKCPWYPPIDPKRNKEYIQPWPQDWNEAADQEKINEACRRRACNHSTVRMGYIHKFLEDCGFIQLNFGPPNPNDDNPDAISDIELKWVKLGRKRVGTPLLGLANAFSKLWDTETNHLDALTQAREMKLLDPKYKIPRKKPWHQRRSKAHLPDWMTDPVQLSAYLERTLGTNRADPLRMFDLTSSPLLESDYLVYPGLSDANARKFWRRFYVSFEYKPGWAFKWLTMKRPREWAGANWFIPLTAAFPGIEEAGLYNGAGSKEQPVLKDLFGFIENSFRSEEWWAMIETTDWSRWCLGKHPLRWHQDGDYFTVRIWVAKPAWV